MKTEDLSLQRCDQSKRSAIDELMGLGKKFQHDVGVFIVKCGIGRAQVKHYGGIYGQDFAQCGRGLYREGTTSCNIYMNEGTRLHR